MQTVRPENVNGNIIGGVSGQQTRFLLDGVDITEEHQGGTFIQTSVDALQEFSVQQNAYSAEFHGAGGTFNAVTKSGSNAFHGSVFEFLRNDAFDAKNFFAAQQGAARAQSVRRHAGGRRDPGSDNGRRTFFFASYEGSGASQGNVVNVIVPSAAQRAGDFQRPRADLRSADHRRQHAHAVCEQHHPAGPAFRRRRSSSCNTSRCPTPPNGTCTANPITAFDSNQVTLRADQDIDARQPPVRPLQPASQHAGDAGRFSRARIDAS